MKNNSMINTGLSLPKAVLELGKARARALRRSFSNHVAVLIEQDGRKGKGR